VKNILAKIYKAMHFPKGIQLFIMRIFEDKFLVGLTGIIFNEKQEILLFKHTYRSHAWALPGGYLKSGEHPREALEREIKEESGLVVSIDEPLKTRTDRDSARLDMCYTGVLIGGDFRATHEVLEYGFFAQDKLPLLRKNQVFLIDQALKQRTVFTHLSDNIL
jgi:ADP-ribose pyrophosphatase YjhB (NUDIX family)